MNSFFNDNINTLSTLLDSLKEGVVIHLNDTRVIYANRAATEILGLSNEELMGKTAHDFSWYFVDENLNKLTIQDYPVSKIFNSNSNLIHQLLGIQLSCGTLRWVDVNGSIITDSFGNKTAMILFSDVTDRKNAFNEVELFKKAVEAIDTGVTIVNAIEDDYPLMFANKAFYTLTGYTQDETIGRNCRFLQGELREQEGRYAIKKALKECTSCNAELINIKKNGEVFNNILTLSPIKLNNTTTHFVGIQHDITYLKNQEEKLKEQASYIQNILDAQEDIVVVTNGEKILFANKSLLHFFNLDSLGVFIEQDRCICNRFVTDPNYFHLEKVAEGELWVEVLMHLPLEQRIVIIGNL